jgi:hypothetical protein
MHTDTLDDLTLGACRMEPVWVIHVELGPEDDDRVRQALSSALTLGYGAYDHVCFESANGTQFFRGSKGTVSGPMETATSRRVRALSFSIPQDRQTLDTAMTIIHRQHSYEEPVIYVQSAFASRARPGGQGNANKWWTNSNTANSP